VQETTRSRSVDRAEPAAGASRAADRGAARPTEQWTKSRARTCPSIDSLAIYGSEPFPVAERRQVRDTPRAARWPEGTQDLGRRDVLPQMSSRTEVLLCPILSATPPCSRSGRPPCCSCPACSPPSAVAEAREADGGRWAASGRRYWCCAGFSMAPGWPSWPRTTESAARRPTGICTRPSTPSPRPRPCCAGRCWPLGLLVIRT
jgi:hypothetical protein